MHSVYLVRHGKSTLDGDEAERGLEPEGIEHAEYIAHRLIVQTPPISAIYSSPYRRAILTAEPLSRALDLDIVVDADFHEKIMSMEPVDDLAGARRRMWKDAAFKLPGGESNAEAQKRAIAALGRLRQAHPETSVAVACHGTLIALMLNSFDGSFGYDAWRSMLMPDIFRVDFPDGETPAIHHIGVPAADGFEVKG